jgi:eukaryotic-like serine/threonine-protein kinase
VQPLTDSPWLRYGLAEGSVVAGKYRLREVLGEGGMGLVVSAHHEALDRTVALKVLRRESAKDAVMVERFLREARAAANLKSEHVAHVLDVGTLPSGAPFMVLEYLQGADLQQVLSRDGRLSVAVACNYVVQACEAVAEAHASGIVHRDLKPENLYLTTGLGGADFVKVLDFGVSKVLSADRAALTTTGIALGSPVYMAPEQVRGSRDVGPRADVWALGVVLYELLTSDLPFEAESLPDLCVKITQDAPLPLSSRRPDAPAALTAVVARCLEKDPAKRYFDAAELAEALAPFAQQVVRGAPTSTRVFVDAADLTVTADTIPAPAPARRRPLALVAVAVVAAGLAAAWLVVQTPAQAGVVLAAADAARSSSLFVQSDVRLEPEETGAVATSAPVTLAPATPAVTSLPAAMPRANASGRRARPVASATVPAPAAVDDIPAFRLAPYGDDVDGTQFFRPDITQSCSFESAVRVCTSHHPTPTTTAMTTTAASTP